MINLITSLEIVLRRSPDCGIILSGDFIHFNDSFLSTHYGYEQLGKAATRNRAILDCGLTCHLCTVGRQCLTEWEHQTTRWCYWSHRVSQPSTRAWSRASLPGAWVTMGEQCLPQRCHIPDGSICTHCLRAWNSSISPRKPWTIYWARVFRTRLCHVIAQIHHGSHMASGT